MSLIDGVFTRVSDDMPLSRVVHATLVERFPVPRPRPETAEVGMRRPLWYCPGCGLPLGEGMKCSVCGKSIRNLVFQRVEIHPHADT
ncbi:MAG TPA: hypothetical protein VGG30_12640 [Pirellulales bacterium]|jgi:hypothetical protein